MHALSKEHSFAQGPLPLRLGHLAASSSCSTASLKDLPHWDSTNLQLPPPMEHSFAQGPLPLGLNHLTASSSHGAQLRSRASPTRTRPPHSFLLPWSTVSLKGLSH
ncbi:hypothetical protein Adt_33535 [Abeliophyllum distichum]|uniref:Uncharacterized protein n=1 Tax=Abeliophyllum distichum TaxID=126358 RepID=A0ABD1QXG7_9LAMI